MQEKYLKFNGYSNNQIETVLVAILGWPETSQITGAAAATKYKHYEELEYLSNLS